ncbi:hypothetical protein BSZ10_11395 [Staphylococcus aureus]|nr:MULTISPECIES: hypothetical protein [Staphylococcus]MCE4992086.1 hypothetical protein [Staphylococcus haemolyticus]MDO0995106.1 hypothetical protein [Staphylococcus borealis]OLF26767.1 hypothetical protein BSZ10_11395 [Staphylococcus aureus]
MMNSKMSLQLIYKELIDEFLVSSERCLLEIERNNNDQLIINFLHYSDKYKTNNKLIQILEIYPDSHVRLKNLVIEVLRGRKIIQKGVK